MNNLQLLIKLNWPYCDLTMQSFDNIMAKLFNDGCLFNCHIFLQIFLVIDSLQELLRYVTLHPAELSFNNISKLILLLAQLNNHILI
jgi:hypothetical protein